MKTEKMWTAITILASIGIGLALYLLYNYLSPKPLEICNVNATINCDAVTKGNLRDFLGLPVPLFGLVGYVGILLSAVYKQKKWVMGLATFGLLFCLRLTYLEIFVENVLCPVCLLCQLDMLTVFALAFMLWRRPELENQPSS